MATKNPIPGLVSGGSLHTKALAPRRHVMPEKVAPEVVANYCRARYVEGKPRIRAYGETVDENVYEYSFKKRDRLFERMKARSDYDEIKDMVMAESNKDMLVRSATLQQKALDLLINTMDKAQKLLDNPETELDGVKVANTTIKTLMPALQAIAERKNPNIERASASDRKTRASKVINA